MAKIVLSDKNLGQFAFQQIRDTIEDINTDNLLKVGCDIQELLGDYWLKQKCFEVTNKAIEKKKFSKNSVTIKQRP